MVTDACYDAAFQERQNEIMSLETLLELHLRAENRS
jgi:hypothetical protein